MDSDEKLRLEIIQLSSMIAASNGGSNPATNLLISTPVRRVNNYNANHLQQHYPSSYRQLYSLSNRPPSISSYKIVRYPNPFNKLCSETYTSQVFPSPSTSNGSLSTNSIAPPTGSSSSSNAYTSRYKLKNISNGTVKVEGSKHPASVPFVGRTIKVEREEEPKPKSIYLNRSHLAKLDSEGSLINLSVSPRPIRPHVNPAHFQLVAVNGSNDGHTVPVTSSSSLTNYQHHTTQPNAMPSTNGCDISSVKSLEQVRASNANTLKTTYKLDRRLKRSPLRKSSKAKIISPNKIQIVPSTKLFKRYSMRMVSASKLSMSRWQHQKSVRKSVLVSVAQHRLLSRRVSQPVRLSSLKSGAVRKGHKSVVHIDGSKFIAKNGGKTLKRMSSKVNNVVSINGNRFIRKNGGKSLKRLSESLSSSKSKPLIIHSQNQTPVARLANRAILKSKLTLSQRSWKKKRFCVFYNRFGECKRKEDGTCPYVHDRKQLMICPKFIVGKCTTKDCKLSHDLKEGRMPPCQFFNKSECSRENCPYPHVKSNPHTSKKSTETVKGKANRTDAKTRSPPRKRKLSTRKDTSPPKKTDKKSKSDRKDPKARYYEQSPVSQPIVSIIPRRLPKESERISTEDKPPTPPSGAIAPSTAASTSATASVVEINSFGTSSTTTSSANDDRRTRLMSRISRLHERVKKKESTAPHFLPFN